MKKITFTSLVALAGLLMAGDALAQTHQVRVDVPFSFVVGNKMLPAGNYRIDSVSGRVPTNQVLIQNTDQPRVAVLVQTSDEPFTQSWGVATQSRLVFDQFGDEHFLREIRGPLAAVNAEIPISTAERKVRRNEVAALSGTNQTVVALR